MQGLIQSATDLVTMANYQLLSRREMEKEEAYMTTVVFASFSLTSPEETKKSLTLSL